MYPYNQYQQPYQAGQQIVKVNGENGARAYQMPANSSVLLLDESAPIVWLKQTDGAGYPTLNPYKIEPYEKPKEPDFNEIIKRIERLEGMIHEKSDTAIAKPEYAKWSNDADAGAQKPAGSF